MFIKRVVIEGAEGDVEIRRTETGAVVVVDGVEIEVRQNDAREARYAVARDAAKVICGRLRSGEPNATNSMVHEVLDEIDRVAGC